MLKTILEVAGMFCFANIVEYAIHRWVLHDFLWRRHKTHHARPDKTVLFVRDWKGAVAASALVGVSTYLFREFGWKLALSEFVFYYFALLELPHWLIHQPWTRFGKHHMAHHADVLDGNYNVWFPLGDYLWRTKI